GAMGRLLNSAEKMDCLEVEVLAAICNFARAEKAAVFLTRRGEWIAFAWDKQEGPCQPAFAVREIVDQVFKQQISMIATVQEKAKSVIAVPLIIRDIMSGALYLERGLQLQPFTGSDLEFVVGLSNYEAVALDHSQRLAQLETENRRMRNEVQLRHKMIGQSPPMQEVYARIARIAPTDATVLIRGETGTGKELAARAIHENSPRAGQLFAPINCALLSGALLGSELFGHEKGAFTGAVAQKKGKLEIANGGSVFLDEITELPEVTQSMLLRVLQEHTFERLGGTNAIQADIRIIAATNKNLEATVRARRFRQDLYYRLNVVSVSLPPLRERREDISLLTDYFVRRTSEKKSRVVTGISAEAMAYLQAYHWPGNIRELENAIEHAIVFGGTDHIMPEDLPEPLLARTPQAAVPAIDYQNAVRKAKQQIVRNALEQARGDHAKAAELLHIHPNNLYRLMRDLDVKPRVHMSKSG
ncbi:MAG: sigma 54-interacting transcriptional regulator, partial [Acidobacteriaceae bacterium]|nr:sigma 54-interacting transcriptional regulator [Acidobacteriaceae bacterium]